MEIIKNASRWGNSAGVTLPKNWIGKQVKIVLIDRTKKIKEEVFKILEEELEDLIGIYLTGSYARGDYDENSDIDIIAISNKEKKEISSGKYNISIYPKESIMQTIKSTPVLIFPRILEAKTIINNKLLEELKSEIPGKNSEYISETERIIRINEEVIKLSPNKNVPDSVIYSLVIRLRGLLLIECLKNKKILKKRDFHNYLKRIVGVEVDSVIEAYQRIKNDLEDKEIIKIQTAKKILEFIKEEVKKIDQ